MLRVLTLAVAGPDPDTGRAAVLAVAYCLGLGLPFVLIAAAYERWTAHKAQVAEAIKADEESANAPAAAASSSTKARTRGGTSRGAVSSATRVSR